MFNALAPTNGAFAKLLAELNISKAELLAAKPLLTAVPTHYVFPRQMQKAQAPTGKVIKTVQGETFTVSAALDITDKWAGVANIAATNAAASNGVIHIIDKVILPAS